MEQKTSHNSADLKKIFRFMMENGYYPTYEGNYILFDYKTNMTVLEYEDGILSIRTFFTINSEAADMFMEASNFSMLECFMVKPAIMNDMESIMFSCETICPNMRDFKRFFPRMLDLMDKGLECHKREMRRLLTITEKAQKKIPATDESFTVTGKSRGKQLS